jgi:hypothetical protein
MHGEEGSKSRRQLVIYLRKRTMSVPWFNVMNRMVPLTLDDHVMQDHASSHHICHLIFRPSKSWVPNNNKSSLEHTKCSLDVLPASS